MVTFLLQIAFNITRRRVFSDMISTRNAAARWAAAERAHKRKGGYIVTVDGPSGVETYFM